MLLVPIASFMNRRTYLLTVGGGTILATAGCITDQSDSDPESVVLPEPDDQRAESEDLAYPAYGQQFPAFELPDATSDTVIDTGDLDGVAVVTTFFASCPAECGILLNHLAGVQSETINRGLSEEVRFLAITFDPERDDEQFLRENSERVGADLSAGNWHNLRPEDTGKADEIVSGELGVGYERVEDGRLEDHDFNHFVVTWLVNPDGAVERIYRGEHLDTDRVIDDIESVTEEY